MRRGKEIFQSASVAIIVANLLVAGWPAAARAEAANEPSLVISQLKITSSNGQFITLYNASDVTLDMGKYRLEYFNNYDLAKVTSSRLISLTGSLPPHSYFMINDDTLTLCYRLTVDSVSLGLSSTAGLLQLSAMDQTRSGSLVAPLLQDYVGWSKTAASGAQTLPAGKEAFLERRPVDAENNPSIASPGAGTWQAVQPDPANACNLVSATDNSAITTGLTQLLPGSEPPATILSLDTDRSAAAQLPATDIGLMSPAITELLPNPAGTGNDARDEFIELYNPNEADFDLTGFALQTGIKSLHVYKFPAGSNLPPHAFQAFYASITGLTLSNSGSQAKLLDPFGNSIAATDIYGTAKDGQAWALANGKWYWTTRLTPNAANIINQPPAARKPAAKAAAGKKKAAKSAAKAKSKKAKTAKLSANHGGGEAVADTPIHLWSLALVAAAALLYGAYEYREDFKNRLHEFRGHLRTRRESRA